MGKASRIRTVLATGKRSFTAIVVASVLVAGGGMFVWNAVAPRADSGMMVVEPVPGATLEIDREEAELGSMAVDEVRSADFKLTNVGTAPVEIAQVRTSCMCTYAEVTLPDGKSPEFNMDMHNSEEAKQWKGALQPGESAVVTLIYMPELMPVQGSVARTVKFATNDPQHQTVELGIHATVL